jgi:hypothetical protein
MAPDHKLNLTESNFPKLGARFSNEINEVYEDDQEQEGSPVKDSLQPIILDRRISKERSHDIGMVMNMPKKIL